MGFSLEWLAIKGATAEQACAALEAERTGTYADIYSAPIMGASLPSGYYLILVEYFFEVVALHESFVASPGLENEVLSFMCYEGIMATQLHSWTNGRRNWSLSRFEQTEPFEIEGEVPEPLSTIRAKLTLEQEEADRNGDEVDVLFDMPADLGKALTGFRYDENHDPAIRFEVLRLKPGSRFRVPSRAVQQNKPWWKFW